MQHPGHPGIIAVHLVYLDDSRKDRHIQIICAVIIPGENFDSVEQHFGHTIEQAVPDSIKSQDGFEFHASDMYHGNGVWANFPRDQALAVLARGTDALACMNTPCVTYGKVDLLELRKGLYGSADPIDVAFRLCCASVECWFEQYAETSMGIFISDDTENKQVKQSMRKAFRDFRQKVASSPRVRGTLDHALDDIYFGSSTESVGIQLADICAFIIRRHIAGAYADTADLYEKLKPKLFPGRCARPGNVYDFEIMVP